MEYAPNSQDDNYSSHHLNDECRQMQEGIFRRWSFPRDDFRARDRRDRLPERRDRCWAQPSLPYYANVTFEIEMGADGRSRTLIESTLSSTTTFPDTLTHCH